MVVNDQNAKILQTFAARLGEVQAISDAGPRFVRARGHRKREIEISGAPCHWSDHRKIADAWHQARNKMSTRRYEIQGRLMRVNAAIMRRHAQRAADVGAERQRPKTGAERRRRSARRSTRR